MLEKIKNWVYVFQQKKQLQLVVTVVSMSIVGTVFTFFARAQTVITSAKSGAWSDVSTWQGGRVPGATDKVVVMSGHDVLFDQASVKISGMDIAGTLTFDPNKSTQLDTDANVVVTGQLVMVPKDATIIQHLRFVNIDEATFVGKGMDVLDTDVGLWVMGSGQLYTKGTARSGWLRMANAMASGSNSFTLEKAPTGWRVGDSLSIAPNDYGKGYNSYDSKDDFHEAKITAINGATVTIDKATVQNNPKVNNLWTTEVMNLTRNVIIGGTASGKSHSFIRSSKPQFIRYTTFEHMGPRNGANLVNNQTGRYGLHFHHGMDGSVGSIVEGTIVKDTNNHAFVPHMSHGITFRDTLSYNTKEDAYWWDDSETTHDVLYDHAMAAKVGHHDPDGEKFEFSGFFLGAGNGNAIRDSVGVGLMGPDGGAFFWNNGSSGLWEFDEGNISHNNVIGMRVWQNTGTQHTIRDLVAYHNDGAGVVHGAYVNNYLYEDIHLYGNGSRESDSQFSLGANSRSTAKIRIANSIFDAAGRTSYALSSGHSAVPAQDTSPNELRGVTFKGYTGSAIHMTTDGVAHKFDVIDPTFANNNEVTFASDAPSDSWVRVQKASGSYRATKLGKTNITRVAPTIWGTGTGIKTTWYDDQNLQDKKAEDIFQYIEFESEELEPPHHKVNNPDFSVRFEGQIEAPFSETYTFHTRISDGQRLYINGQPVIDSWRNQLAEERTGTFTFVAGQKYNFVLEAYEEYNQGAQVAKGAINLEWSSPRTPRAYIPTSQFYPKTPLPNRDVAIAAEPTLPSYISSGGGSGGGTNPAPTIKAGDINGDGNVNIFDLSLLLANWNSTTAASSDINKDGRVNIFDLSLLLANWNS